MKHLVLYHARCNDGYMAAAAFSASAARGAPHDVEYRPIAYTRYETLEAFKEFLGDIDDVDYIWFLDTCPTLMILDYLITLQGPEIIIVDHHLSALVNLTQFHDTHPAPFLSGKIRAVFATERSGASLTVLLFRSRTINNIVKMRCTELWKEMSEAQEKVLLVSNTLDSDAINDILYGELNDFDELVEVRDLWIQSDPATKARADALSSYLAFHNVYEIPPQDFTDWWVKQGSLTDVVEKGFLIDAVGRATAEDALRDARYELIETAKGPVHFYLGNCPSKLGSVFGEAGYMKHPDEQTIVVGLHVNYAKDGITLSIRSRNIKALPLAVALGGGGHPNACGARIDAAEHDVKFTTLFATVRDTLIKALEGGV